MMVSSSAETDSGQSEGILNVVLMATSLAQRVKRGKGFRPSRLQKCNTEVRHARSVAWRCRDAGGTLAQLRTHSRLALSVALLFVGCPAAFDDTRVAGPEATLGDDMFGVLCDRVGAGSFTEDLTGASYHRICHYSATGAYADKVDVSSLPPTTSNAGAEARKLSVGKMEAMVRHRSALIRAFNAAFPDKTFTSARTGQPMRIHAALLGLTQQFVHVVDSGALPRASRSLGELFGNFAKDEDTRASLGRLSSRVGYRPVGAALGAVRPALSYPLIRDLLQALKPILGENGSALPEFRQLTKALQMDLATARSNVAKLGGVSVEPSVAQPSRPRSNIEVTAAMFQVENPLFAPLASDPERYIVRRDRRGLAVPAGNVPGVVGTVPEPFVDTNGDGYADADARGRFLGSLGKPLNIDPPFRAPGIDPGPLDAFGRPDPPLYEYIDTSRTALRGVSAMLLPTLSPVRGDVGGEDAWKDENETVMYALAGARVLLGDREDRVYDFATDSFVSGDCDTCLRYSAFRGEDSPLVAAAHAVGQVLADEESDTILAGLLDALEQHEQVVARVVGAGLRARELTYQHDKLAEEGKEPRADLAYEVPIWDEMATNVIAPMFEHPRLLGDLLAALANPIMIEPKGGVSHIGEAVAAFMEFKDELNYDPANINGPSVNLTAGGTVDPETPVDWSQPQRGTNRSMMERSLRLIRDAFGARQCNKPDATVYVKVGGVEVPPVFGPYEECDLLVLENLGLFYIDSTLPKNHPKRSTLNLKPEFLSTVLDVVGNFASVDEMLEESSSIEGMSLSPSYTAINRLIFFGSSSDQFPNIPDLDVANLDSDTNKFVSALLEPAFGYNCPRGANDINRCADVSELMRIRNANTSFLLERFGFVEYLAPVIQAFAEVSCSEDATICDKEDFRGELILAEVFHTLQRHWPGKDHGTDCSDAGNAATNLSYCSGAGVNAYQPLMADVFRTDLMPAMHAFADLAVNEAKVRVARGERAGEEIPLSEVLERATRVMFDPVYAQERGIQTRSGDTSAKWVDGTPQAQLTVFNLLADALHAMDVRFDSACGGDADCEADVARRKGQWKRARSQLVDALVAVDGEGESASFKNPQVVPLLRAVLQITREQLNANCPEREVGVTCTWAKEELAQKLADTIGGPVFAATMDVLEKIRESDDARRAFERLALFLLEENSPDGLASMLASAVDILQTLQDDGNLAPVLRAASSAIAGEPGYGVEAALHVAMELASDTRDPHHVLEAVLPTLVAPMDDGRSPVEVIMDAVADVNRVDASKTDALSLEDYRFVHQTVADFLTDRTRGLEQFYTILLGRAR